MLNVPSWTPQIESVLELWPWHNWMGVKMCKRLVYFDSSSNVTWPRVTFMTDPAGACTLFLKDMTHGYKDLWSPRFHFNFTMIKSLPLLNFVQCPAKYWHININWTVAIPMANNSFYHKALLVPCGWAHNKCSNLITWSWWTPIPFLARPGSLKPF